MKAFQKIFIVIFLLCAINTYAQESEKEETQFMTNAAWRLGLTYPLQFGDHALAKSYDHGLGFQTQLYILSYHGFRLGGGFEFIQYSVNDKQKIGNFNVSNNQSFYGLVSYEKKFGRYSLMPQIGYGSCVLRNRSSSVTYGHQDGKEFRIGAYGQYRTGRATYAFLGVQYVQSNYTINTTREFMPYFGEAQQIQLSAGFLFD